MVVSALLGLLLSSACTSDVARVSTEPLSYCVQPDGDARNDCLSCSAACPSLDEAFARFPQILRHDAVVFIDAGSSYRGAALIGIVPQAGTDGGNPLITIRGALPVAFVPDAGSSTGTVTAATQCSLTPPSAPATLSDSSQSLAPNNLFSRFVEILTGPGAGELQPIVSNTGDTMTVASCWTVTPTTSSTYAIRDLPTVINTAAGGIGIGIANIRPLTTSNTSTGVLIENIKTTTGGLTVTNATVTVNRSWFGANTGSGLFVNGSKVRISRSIFSSNSGAALGAFWNAPSQADNITDSLFWSASSSVPVLNMLGVTGFKMQANTVMATNAASPALVQTSSGLVADLQLLSTRFNCVPGSSTYGVRISNANNGTPFANGLVASYYVDSSTFSDCGTAISLVGRMVHLGLDDTTFSADGGTTALEVASGASLNLDSSSVISGSFAHELRFDGDDYSLVTFRALPGPVLFNNGTIVQGIP